MFYYHCLFNITLITTIPITLLAIKVYFLAKLFFTLTAYDRWEYLRITCSFNLYFTFLALHCLVKILIAVFANVKLTIFTIQVLFIWNIISANWTHKFLVFLFFQFMIAFYWSLKSLKNIKITYSFKILEFSSSFNSSN
jgi:hypothetical protein